LKTTWPILLSLLLLAAPAAMQAQGAYSTNADGSIYTYSTNADGSANIVAYAGPPWVVTIPTNINGLTVTSIGEGAFDGSGLTSVTIPNSVTSIADDAFVQCNSLTGLTIGDSVTNIGDGAFEECRSLANVTIPNSVISIGIYAFIECSSLTNIAVDAANPNYRSTNGVLFDKDQATLIQYPSGLTNSSYTIPSSVTSIGFAAFGGCPRLTSVTIPNSVTSIGDLAFSLTSLTSVTIPDSVTNIGAEAFQFCSSLANIIFSGNAPLVDGVAGSADSTVFQGESGTVYYYAGTTGWGSTYGGWPTVELFAPQIGGGGIGIQSGNFGFTITGVSNQTVVVEASTNLLNWQVIQTITLSGASTNFFDSQWTNYPERFYRAVGAFTVGGTLTGLAAGDTVTLQDNGADNLTLSTNGTFTFPTALPNGHTYSVTGSGTGGGTVTTYTFYTATANGSGTISGANVTNVAVRCTGPVLTGDMALDMLNAAVADGTAHGGVPGVMLTENGGPFRVTAPGTYSYDVSLRYYPWSRLAITVGSNSCSSTTFPSGTLVIQFGIGVACGQTFGYGY
jgi:hypothetical protein